MISNGYKITCKQCGRQAEADKFVLDPHFKKVVCPQCVKERKTTSMINTMKREQPAAPVAEKKPAGWDAEDEALERMRKQRATVPVATAVKIDDEKIRCTCPKCSYSFVYNSIRKTPTKCPYCGNDIANIRMR